MARFCTTCGTRSEHGAGFCEECGTALRPRADAAPTGSEYAPSPSEPAETSVAAAARGRWLLPAVLGAAVLIVVVGGVAWWMSPAAAGPDAFASALRGPSGASAAPSTDLLCLANLPYDHAQINVQPYDAHTRQWMDALASAGLYSPGQSVPGMFQSLMQYTATPELDKWRRGARLCVAKDWSMSEVKAGGFTPEKRGQHTLYRASAVWKAEGVAPWAARIPAGQFMMPGVTADGGVLTAETSHVFALRDRHWVVLTGAELGQIQREHRQAAQRGGTSNDAKADQGGMLGALSNIFRGFGAAHPLVGEWAIDQSAAGGFFGPQLPFKGGRITFGKDYMESGGERVKTRFDVQGDVVSVRTEGESDALRFRIKDRNNMVMDFGPVEIPFNRVR